ERGQAEYVAPRTATEQVLAEVWAEVLHLERVGIHDNFFELGGHSLLATQVIARVRQVLQVDLPLRALLDDAATVAELAIRLEELRRARQELKLPPLVPQPRAGGIPLSYAQERLWFLDQLTDLGKTYHECLALRLEGRLDIGALERSITELATRHEILRTRIKAIEGRPLQVVESPSVCRLRWIDFPRATHGYGQDEAVRRLLQEESARLFDLGTAPLFRAVAVRLGTDDHLLLISMHHIITDGWSLRGVIPRELGALYRSALGSLEEKLSPLDVQYADYAIWQRSWLQGEVLGRQLGYWKEQLAGAPAMLQLPTDHPRPTVPSYRGGSVPVELPERLVRELRALARAEQVTLFMLLLAAFQLLLSRWSGQSDVVVGSPVAGRSHRSLEGLVGFFVNNLVLRTDRGGDPVFSGLLQRVKQTALGAYAHQDIPFEKLVTELQPVRDMSRQPLFQAVFALQNIPQEELKLPGLLARPMQIEHGTSKFDLTLQLTEAGAGLRGGFEYSSDLFERGTIERMAGHFSRLLGAIVENPEGRLSQLEMLAEAERQQLLLQWNRTEKEYPRERCIHELFAQQARRTPQAVAVTCEGEQLSYAQLDECAERLARRLVSLGVGPEVIVGLCVERGVQMVVGLLGILKAGGAYLPLDPSYPRERLQFMLQDAGAAVLLTH